MAIQFFPLTACRVDAEEKRTALASSVVHLFQDTFTPDPSTVLADYTTNEATFTGYATETFTFNPAILAETSGYMIQSNWVQFEVGATPTVTNMIRGMYLVDTGGDLRLTIIFTDDVPMQIDGQGVGFNVTLLFATGV